MRPSPSLPSVALATNASNSFDRLNQMLNVVQSIQLPFALIPVSFACAVLLADQWGWVLGALPFELHGPCKPQDIHSTL